MRIGQGYDVHRLVEGRPLILGGVSIAHHLGLDGHSDADVLLHAICDALLGAAALGDIGQHFPDTDKAYAGADSRGLMRQVVSLLVDHNYRVVNVDSTIIAQQPRLSPYIDQMRSNIATDLGVASDAVNVKATTTERLGFVGKEQGIAAEAVALIEKNDHPELSPEEDSFE